MPARLLTLAVCIGVLFLLGCGSAQSAHLGREHPGFAAGANAADALSSAIQEDLRDVFLADPPTDVMASNFYWGTLEAVYTGQDNGNRSIYGRIVIHPDDIEDWEADFEDLPRPQKLPAAPVGIDWWLTPAQARDADFFNCAIDGAGPGSFIAATADGSKIFIYIAQWAPGISAGKSLTTQPAARK